MTLARGAGLFLATDAASLFHDPVSVPPGSEQESDAAPRQRTGNGPGYRNRPSRWDRPGVIARTTR